MMIKKCKDYSTLQSAPKAFKLSQVSFTLQSQSSSSKDSAPVHLHSSLEHDVVVKATPPTTKRVKNNFFIINS